MLEFINYILIMLSFHEYPLLLRIHVYTHKYTQTHT